MSAGQARANNPAMVSWSHTKSPSTVRQAHRRQSSPQAKLTAGNAQGRQEEMEQHTKPLLPLDVFLQGTVAFIFSTCTHVEKLTPHSLLGASVSLAERVVNLHFFSE
jgi:hypothetical protein